MLGNRKIELRIVKDDSKSTEPNLLGSPATENVEIYTDLASRAGKAVLKGAIILVGATALIGVFAHAAHNAIDLTINN